MRLHPNMHNYSPLSLPCHVLTSLLRFHRATQPDEECLGPNCKHMRLGGVGREERTTLHTSRETGAQRAGRPQQACKLMFYR